MVFVYGCVCEQAAEQAKASPALVAKDPSTVNTKKEEEDLAKGKCFCCDLDQNIDLLSVEVGGAGVVITTKHFTPKCFVILKG